MTNKCYELDRIRENQIQFDEQMLIGEDLKFNLDFLDKIPGKFGVINIPLYHYVKRSNESLSLTYHEGDLEDTKDIYKRFINWEKRQNNATEDDVLVIKSIYITD